MTRPRKSETKEKVEDKLTILGGKHLEAKVRKKEGGTPMTLIEH